MYVAAGQIALFVMGGVVCILALTSFHVHKNSAYRKDPTHRWSRIPKMLVKNSDYREDVGMCFMPLIIFVGIGFITGAIHNGNRAEAVQERLYYNSVLKQFHNEGLNVTKVSTDDGDAILDVDGCSFHLQLIQLKNGSYELHNYPVDLNSPFHQTKPSYVVTRQNQKLVAQLDGCPVAAPSSS